RSLQHHDGNNSVRDKTWLHWHLGDLDWKAAMLKQYGVGATLTSAGHQLLDQFRVQVQALARFDRHFFLAFAWHKSGSLVASLCLAHKVSDRLYVPPSIRSNSSRRKSSPHR
ncbi:hypothetical protein, partial [Burkholderia cepacia]|uniref:hypothetical protein n=1 Tax=Burkholderia cepacia TaxID=292 RepID=UPI001ABBDE98